MRAFSSAGLPIPTAMTRESPAPGARIAQTLPLDPLNCAALRALAMAPPVASSACCQTPDGISPSPTNSTRAPDFGKAGLAKLMSSILLELPWCAACVTALPDCSSVRRLCHACPVGLWQRSMTDLLQADQTGIA